MFITFLEVRPDYLFTLFSGPDYLFTLFPRPDYLFTFFQGQIIYLLFLPAPPPPPRIEWSSPNSEELKFVFFFVYFGCIAYPWSAT